MAYGDHNGLNKLDQGQEGGSCNRTRCQASPANWYNHGSYSWYCADCRYQIEFDPINSADWQRNFYPHFKHPMFETRQMIDVRTTGASHADQSGGL